MIADDDDRFRSLVSGVLADDGYEVLGQAHDASSAVETVRARRPDVVVLDLVMEGSEGLSTLHALLADDPTQAVVVISSLFDPAVEQQVISLGAWYLEKAEGLEALERCIDVAAAVPHRQH